MKFEYVIYAAASNYEHFCLLIRQIPKDIKKEFIQDPHLNETSVWVETKKTKVIRYLDKIFCIDQTREVNKHIHLEVDKAEISNYLYFDIVPTLLEWDRQVFCDIKRPTCQTDSCPVGSEIVSPVRITQKKSKRIGIAEIGRPWDNQRELIISAELKEIFDSEGITGLEYEPCIFDERDKMPGIEVSPPYLAHIKHATGQFSDDILVTRYYCEKHSIPLYFHLFGEKLTRDVLSEHDFQTINRITVKDRVYYYRRPRLIITRKTLELLLKHKIRGLTDPCFFLNEKFAPVVLTDGNHASPTARKKDTTKPSEKQKQRELITSKK